MKISKRKVQLLLIRQKKNQAELSRDIGVSASYLCAVLSGKSVMPQTVGKISDALQVDPEEILEEEGK